MNEDQPTGQGADQQNALIVHSDQTLIQRFGFSAEFPSLVKDLNDTLSRLEDSTPQGFNLEFYPDSRDPSIEMEVKFKDERPFKVEIAGGLNRGNASVRVTNQRHEWNRASTVSLPDLQEFVSTAFPDRKATIKAEPSITYRGPVMVTGTPPEDLYEEEMDPEWRQELQSARARSTERLLVGILPPINMSLEDVTEEELGQLSDQIGNVKVEATFYQPTATRKKFVSRRVSDETGSPARQLYSDFEIEVDGKTLIRMYVDSIRYGREHVGTYCYIKELNFYGMPQEVELVIKQFLALMQKTESYRKSD